METYPPNDANFNIKYLNWSKTARTEGAVTRPLATACTNSRSQSVIFHYCWCSPGYQNIASVQDFWQVLITFGRRETKKSKTEELKWPVQHRDKNQESKQRYGSWYVQFELSSWDCVRRFPTLITELFISQLTFSDGQVRDLLEEMGAYLEGHLAILDNVSSIASC